MILLSGLSFAALTDDLEIYFNLDSNFSDSVGSNDGSGHGDATTFSNATCMTDGCYHGDGSGDWIEFGDYYYNYFTIMGWVFFEDFVNDRGYYFSKDTSTGRELLLNVDTGRQDLRGLMWDSGSTIRAYYEHFYPNKGEWYHIATIHNASGFFLYVNGTKKDETLGSWTLKNTGTPPFLGGWKYLSKSLKGHIDEWGIWSRGLTETEILEGYNNHSAYNILEGTGGDEEETQCEYSGSGDWTIDAENCTGANAIATNYDLNNNSFKIDGVNVEIKANISNVGNFIVTGAGYVWTLLGNMIK